MTKQRNVYIWLSVLFSIALLCQQRSEAQTWKLMRYEIFSGLSTCHYFGDIGGSATANNWFGLKDIEVFSTRPSLYFGGRYYISERVSFQTSLNFGMIYGTDKNSRNNDRNYEFSTSFLLPRFNIEYTLFKINDLFGMKKYSFLSYSKPMNRTFMLNVSGGAGLIISGININEKMKQDQQLFNTLPASLYKINTSKKSHLSFSAGLGVRYFFVKPLAISASLEYQYSASDYLDGYFTHTNVNDMMWIVSFGMSYRLPTNEWGKITFIKRK